MICADCRGRFGSLDRREGDTRDGEVLIARRVRKYDFQPNWTGTRGPDKLEPPTVELRLISCLICAENSEPSQQWPEQPQRIATGGERRDRIGATNDRVGAGLGNPAQTQGSEMLGNGDDLIRQPDDILARHLREQLPHRVNGGHTGMIRFVSVGHVC